MDWLAFSLLTGLAATVLVVPGLLLGWSIGLRGALAVLSSVPFSIALIGTTAIILAFIVVPWSPLSFIVTSAIIVGLLHLGWWLRRLTSERIPILRIDGFNWTSLLVGMAISTVLVVATMAALFPSWDYFAQTNDNIFHLNAIRYIFDSGQASSFSIGRLNAGGNIPTFYPAAWHGYVSLVAGFAHLFAPGVTIAATVNAATICVILGSWTLGALALTQVVAGPSIKASVIAAAVLNSVYLFPWMFIEWGSLYPNLIGFSVLPGGLAVLFLLSRLQPPPAPETGGRFASTHPATTAPPSGSGEGTRVHDDEAPPEPSGLTLTGVHPRTLLFFILGGYATASLIGHPTAFFSFLFAGIVVAWGLNLGSWMRRSTWLTALGRVLISLALVAISVGFAWAWVKFAPARPTAPPPLTDPGTELANLAMGTVASFPVTPLVAVLIVVGVVAAMWRRQFIPVVFALAAAALFVYATGAPTDQLAEALGGLFYRDTKRIAALWFLLSVPVILVGIGGVCTLIDRLGAKLTPWRPQLSATVMALVFAIGIAAPLQMLSVQPQVADARTTYTVPSANSKYVSPDEFTLMTRLADALPRDAKVIDDPGNGSAFIYAISGVPVVFTHLFIRDSPAMAQLRNGMFDRNQLPATCAAMKELNAYYFADFGRQGFYFTGPKYYPGLADPDKSMLKEVARQGDAAIYEFTACAK